MNTDPQAKVPRRELPIWMPFLALLAALIVAVIIGIRICPALTALVFPPSSPLPDGVTDTPITHENKGYGLDEFVYASNLSGCEIAHYYETRLGNCQFEPDSGCNSPSGSTPPIAPPSSGSYSVAECSAEQSYGPFYYINWTAYVGTGYTQGGLSRIRIVREISSGPQQQQTEQAN